jgi:Tfp pilus assembly protein PilE
MIAPSLNVITRKTLHKGSVLIYGLIILAVVAAVIGVVYSYNSAIKKAEKLQAEKAALNLVIKKQEEEKVQLKQANDINLLAISILEAEKKKLQEINSKRQVRVIKVAAQEKKVDDKLVLAISKEPVSKAWADTPVPDAILASLRDNSTPEASGNRSKDRETTSPKGTTSEATDSWLAGEVDQLGTVEPSERMETTSFSV